MGDHPIRFAATLGTATLELVVPKWRWIKALRETGHDPEQPAIGLAPAKAYRLIEAEATHQIYHGNMPAGSVLALG